jgi:predicted XRE-type DNA-binding protein
MGRLILPPSTGNVFADLGLREPDVELAKADLAIRIYRLAEHRRLTPDEAAALLNVPRSELRLCSRDVWRRVRSTSCCEC